MDRSSGDGLLAAKRPRRSVQSKLSFAPRANGSACDAATPQAVATEDGGSNSEEGEKDCKRRRNKKIKPPGRDLEVSADSNKEAKESSGYRKKSTRVEKNKRSGDKTPSKYTTPTKSDQHGLTPKRRTLNRKLDNFIDCDDEKIDQPFCDLWSEAKKAAEENLRLSAGKQAHPFFSICRASKVLSGAKHVEKSENRNWLALDGDYCISLPPVHVFETVKDDVALPDWKNWKFLETKPPKLDCHSSMEVSSVFEGSINPLKLEASCEKGRMFDHLLYNDKMNSAHGATSSSNLSNGLASKEQPLSHFELVHVSCNFSQPSALGSNADAQNQDRLHKRRMESYSQRSIGCPDCSLWTDKYRPGISLEVCGNTESVMLLCDWLKSWQEKGGQNSLKEISRNCYAMEDSEDSSYDIESDMDGLYCGETLKNVLLITGPVGSGKSAAIYACAREQGFKVIEVNASSLRNGAYMRQTFGEGVDSLGLTHWLAEDQTHQRSEHAQEMLLDIPIVAENGLEAPSVEVNSKICERENATDKSLHSQIANKTLFLFEEVDVVFDEDHGFISTILKLAETTKRPIILTSNSKQPVLPQLLDRLILDFKAPSYPELLYHASMVCAFEKIHISCNLLEQIVEACLGDTRRVLMLLQFWCQGTGDITDKKIPCTTGAVPFDIDAVHLAIPKVIPWDFRCELSEKVEEEISKTVSSVEEDSFVKLMLQHEVNSREILDLSEKLNTHTAKSRKKGKLRRKHSLAHREFSDHMNNLEGLLCDSDPPSMCVQRTSKTKRRVVLSSQSDDELSSDELKSEDMLPNKVGLCSDELKPEDTSPQTNGLDFLTIPISPTLQSQDIYGPLQIDQMDKSRTNFAVRNSLDISEIASTSHVCDTFRMQDESSMLESSFITGSETNLNFTFVSKALFQNSESTSFDLNTSLPILPHADINSADGAALESSKPLESHVGAADVHIELHHGNQDIGCFQNEPEEHRPSQCQLMDECSQADFNAESVARDTNACPQEIASVPETWRKLRSCENLKSMLSNSKDVALVASLTSGLADLISETDIMFRSCTPIVYDNLEPTSTACIEPDSFAFYDELVEMGSTFAQHGLCFYTMKCTAAGSCLGWKSTSDLAQEMLASSTNSSAIGKLLIQETITGQSTCFNDADAKAPQSFKSTGRESVDDLYNAFLLMVPARLSMILRGVAFHEYLSFIAQMSRSECSRLAERIEEKQTRRSRTSRHYLSSGAHQLTSEQVEGLARRCCFTRAAPEMLSYYDSEHMQ